ncbi:calcium-binding protein [Microvirga sp. CF3062]|uniref:calcium-binding protein n=1 Tax=Microvirga sp. CF3062 TaxID=3110182 RepID=UPI002E779B29|nr:calcium-binding protein [Microvirga sp. CF3062]MEE1656378.1 calcium-binding protein [Microvirga sp. CF3062]
MAVRTGTNRGDALRGTRASDTLEGLGGDDTIVGGRGNDILNGGAGDDLLRGGQGRDRLIGGFGEDWADYRDATTAVTVSLGNAARNTGEALGDRYSSIERLRGGRFDDNLTGNSRDNVLEGVTGADILNGGRGFDFARYKAALTGVTASLADPSVNTGHAAGDTYFSIEGLQGSDFADTLIGNDANNVLVGGRGADTFDGRGGFDFVRYDMYHAGSQGVIVNLAAPASNTGRNALGDTYTGIEGVIGTRFADRLVGDDAANNLQGQSGNDRLIGNLGNDTVIGGSGNDNLSGGYGNDLLQGDAGRDVFTFDSALNALENVDRIRSFSIKNDTIRLDDAIFTGLARGFLTDAAFYRGTEAHDSNDRIIYDRVTGAVYFDPDGDGAAAQVQFARMTPRVGLKNDDFFVF